MQQAPSRLVIKSKAALTCIVAVVFLCSCVQGENFPNLNLNSSFFKNFKSKENGGSSQESQKPKVSTIPTIPTASTVPVPTVAPVSNGVDTSVREMGFVDYKKISTERLLDEKGNWHLVEQGGAMDPTQAHMKARENVNVKRRSTKKELSAHFEPDAKSGEDGKIRVLRLEINGHDEQDGEYDIAESSVVKPTHTIVENELLQKIKKIFGEADMSSQSISSITPKRKPVSGGGYGDDVAGNFVGDEEHMVNGIAVPPVLPSNRMAAVTKADLSISLVKPSVPVRKLYSIIDGDVLPGYKPAYSKIGNNYAAINQGYGAKQNLALMDAGRSKVTALPKGNMAEAIKLRTGAHSERTRLVIEVTKTTKYKVAIDHVRNVLRVKLENTKWSVDNKGSFDKQSHLLGSYVAVQQEDNSTLLEIRLKKTSKIIDTMILRPNLSSKHRVVIDLK